MFTWFVRGRGEADTGVQTRPDRTASVSPPPPSPEKKRPHRTWFSLPIPQCLLQAECGDSAWCCFGGKPSTAPCQKVMCSADVQPLGRIYAI